MENKTIANWKNNYNSENFSSDIYIKWATPYHIKRGVRLKIDVDSYLKKFCALVFF